jgi:hydrogenase expression/formation protein HypC
VSCEGDRCITCGDVAVPATVVAVDGVTATVEIEGGHEQVGIDVVGSVEVGEVLLCHAGIAIDKLEVTS